MLTETQEANEEAFVRAFVSKNRQERCMNMLSNPKFRKKITWELAHFKWFDERFVKPLLAREAHTASEVAALLRRKGSPETVWVISEWDFIDGRAIPLDAAIEAIWGGSMGSILICNPTKLALYRGESMKSELLLHRF